MFKGPKIFSIGLFVVHFSQFVTIKSVESGFSEIVETIIQCSLSFTVGGCTFALLKYKQNENKCNVIQVNYTKIFSIKTCQQMIFSDLRKRL